MVAKYWLERIARIAGRGRYRLRVPLPRAGDAARRGGAVHLAIGRDRRHAGGAALCRVAGRRTSSRSSTSRKARSRARPTSSCRPWPARRSASPRPRPSRPSSRCWPRLTIAMARARGAITHDREARSSAALTEMPSRAAEVLNHDERLREIAARDRRGARRALSRPRHAYPLALEGALKLKEISYIHAEGYAAGEMKHGPIALIDESVPVIVLAPHDDLFEKTLGNVEEVMARGGRVVMISDAAGCRAARRTASPTASRCPHATRSSRRCSTRSRSSSSPTTPPSSKAPTSTSPATSPKASRWSSAARLAPRARALTGWEFRRSRRREEPQGEEASPIRSRAVSRANHTLGIRSNGGFRAQGGNSYCLTASGASDRLGRVGFRRNSAVHSGRPHDRSPTRAK